MFECKCERRKTVGMLKKKNCRYVCVFEKVKIDLSVCVCEREREREGMRVKTRERKRNRDMEYPKDENKKVVRILKRLFKETGKE